MKLWYLQLVSFWDLDYLLKNHFSICRLDQKFYSNNKVFIFFDDTRLKITKVMNITNIMLAHYKN